MANERRRPTRAIVRRPQKVAAPTPNTDEIEKLTGALAVVLRSTYVNLDPTFLLGKLLKPDESKLTTPYSQHPWIYAPLHATSIAISQVPFRFYIDEKRAPLGEGEIARSVDRMAEATGFSRDTCRSIWMFAPARRFQAIRERKPALTSSEISRAAGVRELDYNNPWVRLFDHVNDEFTRGELWQATYTHMGNSGECFWLLEGKHRLAKVDEIPVEIWPYGRAGWEPEYDERTKRVASWVWKRGGSSGKGEVVNPHEVVRFRYFNPDGDRGLSSIKPARAEMLLDWYSVIYNAAILAGGGRVGGIFKGFSGAEEARDFIEDFMVKHGGPEKAGIPLALTRALEYSETGRTPTELMQDKVRDRTREGMLAATETPAAALGVVQDANRANMKASLTNWWNSKLIPKMVYGEDVVNSSLLTEARTPGVFGAFDVSGVRELREDLEGLAAVARELWEMGVPLNDINEHFNLGLPEYPWGTRAYIGMGVTQVGEDGKVVDVEATPAETDDDADEPDDESDDDAKDDEPDDDSEEGKAAMRSTQADRDTYWLALKDTLFAPAEALMLTKVRGYFKRLRAEQLAALAAFDGDKPTKALLFDLSKWEREIGKVFSPAYRHIYREATAIAEAEVDALNKGTKAASAKKSEDFFVSKRVEIAKSIPRTVHKQLARTISVASDEGWSMDDLKDEFRSIFNRMSTSKRMNGIARSEAGAATSHARNDTFKRRGVEEHAWVTAADEVVRETHVEYGRAGSIPIGANWAEGKGYTLKFPHDHACSELGEVINCRCVCVPV